MTDVVFFAGPVILKPAFKQIDWLGRDVKIVPIEGAGSSYFAELAESLRDRSGRILPTLVQRYAPGVEIDKIAFAAYSAGHGLLNKLGDNDADRPHIDAMILSDATFNAFSTPAKRGYVKYGIDAAAGNCLFVSTTANTTGGTHMTGRDSWQLVWDAVSEQTGSWSRQVSPRAPVPEASGGWWKMGSKLYWGSYTQPNSPPTQGNDLTHEQHHDLAPAVWQAYLAPFFAGRLGVPWWAIASAGLAAGLGGAWAWKSYMKRSTRSGAQ